MNRLDHWYCDREAWKRHVREELVPFALEGQELGEEVLEMGPPDGHQARCRGVGQDLSALSASFARTG